MIDLAVVFQPNYVMGVPNHSGLYALETARNNIVQILETRQIELGFPMGVAHLNRRSILGWWDLISCVVGVQLP